MYIERRQSNLVGSVNFNKPQHFHEIQIEFRIIFLKYRIAQEVKTHRKTYISLIHITYYDMVNISQKAANSTARLLDIWYTFSTMRFVMIT
jgi:hypothetical protein